MLVHGKIMGSYKAETGHQYEGIFKNGEIIKGVSIYPGETKILVNWYKL